MTTIINVNEVSVIRLLVLALLGRKPYVLAIDPLAPPSRPVLQAIAERLIARHRAQWIIDLCPELEREWDYPTRVKFYNIYAELEPWQDDYFGFADADRRIPDYAAAYKLVTCKHVSNQQFSLLLLKSVLADDRNRIFGLAGDTKAALQAYSGHSIGGGGNQFWSLNTLINPVIGLGTAMFGVGWIISRLRLTNTDPQTFFFAADYMEDERDFRLYKEVEDGGPVLLVRRDPSKNLEKYEALKNYTSCDPGDGFFTLKGILETIQFVIRDCFRLFRHYHALPSALFYQVASLPFRKAKLRAFFNRYRPQYFWGRDDYNVEHTLRRKEIHRVGGESFGINHGTVVESLVQGEFRYLNFDRYYVFGRGVYAAEMQKRWASDMKVIAAGSFGASREDYKFRFKPRSPDILFCVGFFVGLRCCVDIIRAVAGEFPERRVLLQLKPLFIDKPYGRDFVSACRENRSNIEPVQGFPSLFFPQVRYSFSDPSTTILEAIQFGLTSFCIDLSKVQKNGIFREFPGLCVRSGDEAVERIRSIESGAWRYPIEEYGDLVDFSGKVFFDRIREDVGLPAKEPAISLLQGHSPQYDKAAPLQKR